MMIRLATVVAILSLLLATGCEPGAGGNGDAPAGAEGAAAPADGEAPFGQRDVSGLQAEAGNAALQERLPDACPLRVQWTVPLPEITVEKVWLPPAEAEAKYLLVLSEGNDLIAIERSNGMAHWWTELGGKPLGRPAFTRYGVYVIVGGHLLYLERYSGEVIWRLRLGVPPSPYFTVVETERGKPVITVAALNRMIQTFETTTSVWRPKKSLSTPDREVVQVKRTHLRRLWQYPTEGVVEGPIAYTNGRVYAADSDRYVYGLDASLIQTGRPQLAWRALTGGANSAGVLVRGAYAFVASRDRNVYAYSSRTGGEAWRYSSGSMMTQPPSYVVDPATERAALLVNTQGEFLCFDPTTGKPRWTDATATRVAGLDVDEDREASDQTSLILQRDDGSLAALTWDAGAERWTVPAGLFDLVAPNPYEEGAFVVSGQGHALSRLARRR
jgi:outer membrane protein assembly factor BamB